MAEPIDQLLELLNTQQSENNESAVDLVSRNAPDTEGRTADGTQNASFLNPQPTPANDTPSDIQCSETSSNGSTLSQPTYQPMRTPSRHILGN